MPAKTNNQHNMAVEMTVLKHKKWMTPAIGTANNAVGWKDEWLVQDGGQRWTYHCVRGSNVNNTMRWKYHSAI